MIKLLIIVGFLLVGCAAKQEKEVLVEDVSIEDANPYYVTYLELNNGEHLWEETDGHDKELEGAWINEEDPTEGVVLYPNGTFFHFYTFEEEMKIDVGHYSSKEGALYLISENRSPTNRQMKTEKREYTIEDGDLLQLKFLEYSSRFKKLESKGEAQ